MVYTLSLIFRNIDGVMEVMENFFELFKRNSRNSCASVHAKHKLVSLITLYSKKVIRINGLNSLPISLH